MQLVRFTYLLMATMLLTSFLTNKAWANQPELLASYQEVARYKLPNQAAEASGLACLEERLLVINDSGNSATIHELDLTGKLTSSYPIAAPSRDWEALAIDGKHIYIADIGNNHGVNKQLQIYRQPVSALRQKTPSAIEHVSFEFADYAEHPIQPMRHDLDAEAIAINGNQFVVFSKSWVSNQARVYLVDQTNDAELQLVRPVATVTGLPGMVTGAHYDTLTQSYWLVGYNSKGLPKMTPFITRLDDKFNQLEVKLLPGLGQVEAVCLDKQRNLWLAQEQLIFRPALLVKFQPQTN